MKTATKPTKVKLRLAFFCNTHVVHTQSLQGSPGEIALFQFGVLPGGVGAPPFVSLPIWNPGSHRPKASSWFLPQPPETASKKNGQNLSNVKKSRPFTKKNFKCGQMTSRTYKIIDLPLLALFGAFGDFGAFLALFWRFGANCDFGATLAILAPLSKFCHI